MPDPIEITEQDLFAEIGRLYIENKALRQVLEAARPSDDDPTPPDPPPG